VNISDLTTRQIANALVIFAAAMPYGKDAARAALMTAAAESSFKRFANNGASERPEVWAAYGSRANFRDVVRQSLAYPHDAEAGADWTTADSVGLFQQRPMFDYGTIRELMDPAESTRIFVRGSHDGKGRTRYFLESPTTMTLAQRCQWTQGSEFPTGENYAPMETVAEQLIKHFGGFPADNTDWILDMADQAALDKYKREIVSSVVSELNQILRDRTPGSQSLYDEGRYNTQDVLKPMLEDIRRVLGDVQLRLLQPGKAWDNVQDIRGYWLPDIHAQLLAIEAKLGVGRAPNPGANTIPDA
jgi:hypothetical protein